MKYGTFHVALQGYCQRNSFQKNIKMKMSITFMAVLIVGTIMAFGQRAKVGEVRYSVLKPEQFIHLYGKSWVLMDGRNINGTNLFDLTKSDVLPDGRGVFIRGANAKRDFQSGDPDGDRAIGSYQSDALRSHTHEYSDAHFAEVNAGNAGLQGNQGNSDFDNGRCTTNQTTAPFGGLETRPKNIALYCYVKVNKRRAAPASGKVLLP